MTESAEKNFPAYSHLPYCFISTGSINTDEAASFNCSPKFLPSPPGVISEHPFRLAFQ